MIHDPFKYFRIEARELVEEMTRCLLDLEKGGQSPDKVSELLRLAHTLKGAARVVGHREIADLAHRAEDRIAQFKGAEALPSECVSEILAMLDEGETLVQGLDPVKDAGPETRPERELDFRERTLRVSLPDMDELLAGICETAIQLQGLRQIARGGPALDHRVRDDLARSLERLESEVSQLQEKAGSMRLLPFSRIFGDLERAARDAAAGTAPSGSRAGFAFETAGGDIGLDVHVLQQLREILQHVVRNAVTHGLERPEARVAAGKAPVGRVRVEAERRGRRVAIRCSDDGRGMDVEAIRGAAVRIGLLSPEDARDLPAASVLEFAFRPGLSTAPVTTQLAGRGVGLDAVRAAVQGLKGEVRLSSEPGRGTEVSLLVPVSLTSFETLQVEAGDAIVGIPLDAVAGTLRIGQDDLVTLGGRESVVIDGEAVAFVPLAALLASSYVREPRAWTVVILRGREARAAIGVDRLHGVREVVARPMPKVVGHLPLVAGATFDSSGKPQLVLDAGGLVQRTRGAASWAEAQKREPAPILVIDDSYTTRMLERRILEAAGFMVDAVGTAEAGLESAAMRNYGLFVVDLELPGMSGFDFLARKAADLALAETPAIVVSSRSQEEDRARAAELGAASYFVKGEFDQDSFVGRVRELLR